MWHFPKIKIIYQPNSDSELKILRLKEREHELACAKFVEMLHVLEHIEKTTTDVESKNLANAYLSEYEITEH